MSQPLTLPPLSKSLLELYQNCTNDEKKRFRLMYKLLYTDIISIRDFTSRETGTLATLYSLFSLSSPLTLKELVLYSLLMHLSRNGKLTVKTTDFKAIAQGSDDVLRDFINHLAKLEFIKLSRIDPLSPHYRVNRSTRKIFMNVTAKGILYNNQLAHSYKKAIYNTSLALSLDPLDNTPG